MLRIPKGDGTVLGGVVLDYESTMVRVATVKSVRFIKPLFSAYQIHGRNGARCNLELQQEGQNACGQDLEVLHRAPRSHSGTAAKPRLPEVLPYRGRLVCAHLDGGLSKIHRNHKIPLLLSDRRVLVSFLPISRRCVSEIGNVVGVRHDQLCSLPQSWTALWMSGTTSTNRTIQHLHCRSLMQLFIQLPCTRVAAWSRLVTRRAPQLFWRCPLACAKCKTRLDICLRMLTLAGLVTEYSIAGETKCPRDVGPRNEARKDA